MTLTTPEGLARSVDNLQTILAALVQQDAALRAEVQTLQATASQHAHDWERDITGQPVAAELPDHTHGYASLTDKPPTFAPDTHSHAYAATDHTHALVYAGVGHSHGAVGGHSHAWADLSNPPTTYTPSAHTHLDYAASGHSHDLSGYATSGHSHDMSGYATSGHTHSEYAADGHSHDMSGYATSGHTHPYSLLSHSHPFSLDPHSHPYSTSTHTHTVTDTYFDTHDPLDPSHSHSLATFTRTTSQPQ